MRDHDCWYIIPPRPSIRMMADWTEKEDRRKGFAREALTLLYVPTQSHTETRSECSVSRMLYPILACNHIIWLRRLAAQTHHRLDSSST